MPEDEKKHSEIDSDEYDKLIELLLSFCDDFSSSRKSFRTSKKYLDKEYANIFDKLSNEKLANKSFDIDLETLRDYVKELDDSITVNTEIVKNMLKLIESLTIRGASE